MEQQHTTTVLYTRVGHRLVMPIKASCPIRLLDDCQRSDENWTRDQSGGPSDSWSNILASWIWLVVSHCLSLVVLPWHEIVLFSSEIFVVELKRMDLHFQPTLDLELDLVSVLSDFQASQELMQLWRFLYRIWPRPEAVLLHTEVDGRRGRFVDGHREPSE